MSRNILIIYAHHDANSFVKAMLDRAIRALTQRGYDTRVSDLHGMGFKAVADDADFLSPCSVGENSGTDYQSRQRDASRNKSYAPDILIELDKLAWADGVIFLFPYYWFHAPAILKGWFDRVFAYDLVYSNEHPDIGSYARGGLKGKRALVGVTFGAPEPRDGVASTRHSERFEAIQNGVLAYAGFDVLAPFYAWSVAHVGPERRAAYLDAWESRILGLFSEKPELYAADGATPQPSRLLGRVRAPGDQVNPYGGDRSLAGFAAIERLRARPGHGEALLQRLEPLVSAAAPDTGTRIYALLRERDNADIIWLFQTFDDSDAGRRHSEEEPFATILDELVPLLEQPADIIPLIPRLAKGL